MFYYTIFVRNAIEFKTLWSPVRKYVYVVTGFRFFINKIYNAPVGRGQTGDAGLMRHGVGEYMYIVRNFHTDFIFDAHINMA